MAIQAPQTEIYYPESDGKPMAETDAHFHAILDTVSLLSDFFFSNRTYMLVGTC
jgi:hypothetical protein